MFPLVAWAVKTCAWRVEPYCISAPLIGREEEQLVLPICIEEMGHRDGTAKSVSEDVLAEFCCRRVEVRDCVQRVVSKVIPCGSVEGFCTGLGLHNNLPGTGKAITGAVVVFENAEFIDGVDDRENVDVREVAGVHVVYAVQRIPRCIRAIGR